MSFAHTSFKKKLVAGILALMLMLTFLPVTVLAAGEYTVTYNANGGIGGYSELDTSNGGAYSVKSPDDIGISRPGYTFTEWNHLQNGTGSPTHPGVTIPLTSDLTLYAQWEADSYIVTYDGNGQSGGTVPMDANTYVYDDNVTVLGNAGSLVRTDAIFIGWSFSDYAVITSVGNVPGDLMNGPETFIIKDNATLYAVWALDTNGPGGGSDGIPDYLQFSVTYNGNGHTSGIAPVDANLYNSGNVVTTITLGTLVKANRVFLGWNPTAFTDVSTQAQEDALTAMISATSTFQINSNTTLYAVWALDSNSNGIPDYRETGYNITYNANGGTGSYTVSNIPGGATHIVLTQTATGISRPGYTFTEWNDAPDGSGTFYLPGEIINITGNLTLYAQWRLNTVDNVTVTPNAVNVYKGGTQQFTVVVDVTGDMAQTVTWSVDSALSSIDANGLLSVGINETSGTLTVTATSTADLSKKDTATVTVTQYGTPYPVQVEFSVFTGSGTRSATIGAPYSKFLRLLVNGSELGTSNYTVTGVSTTVITLNESYLKTLANGYYRVVAMFSDGQGDTNLVVNVLVNATGITLNKTTASVVVGNTVQLTATISPNNATDKGITWKSSNTSIATVDGNGFVKGMGAGKAIITATTRDGGYTATCEVTVSGSDNGGTTAPIPAPAYYTIDFYNGATLHARRSTNEGNALKTGWPENPAKTGYTFCGWYTGQNGTGTKYTPVSAVFSNLILYAKWTSNSGESASSSSSSSSTATSISQPPTTTSTESESKPEISESAATSTISGSETSNPQTNDGDSQSVLWIWILIPIIVIAAGATGIIIWRRRRNEKE